MVHKPSRAATLLEEAHGSAVAVFSSRWPRRLVELQVVVVVGRTRLSAEHLLLVQEMVLHLALVRRRPMEPAEASSLEAQKALAKRPVHVLMVVVCKGAAPPMGHHERHLVVKATEMAATPQNNKRAGGAN